MDGKTLAAAMTYPGYPAPLSLTRYAQLAPRVSTALAQAGCTTVNRAAMFLAQIGAESGSLRWTQELADGTDYNGRTDLGNTHAGDGPRFKGRSFIQVTGRNNYTKLSAWAYAHGYVPTRTYFVDHPTQLAQDAYAFLGPVWYWTAARPQLNALADAGDIEGATRAVNGGLNNLSGRTARWTKCRSLGTSLLTGTEFHIVNASDEKKIRDIVRAELNLFTTMDGEKSPSPTGHQFRTVIAAEIKQATPAIAAAVAAKITAAMKSAGGAK